MANSRPSLLIDANVFVALFNKDDTLHRRATKLWQSLAQLKVELFTSNLVIGEVLTALRRKAGIAAAVKFGDIVFKETKILEILRTNEIIEQRAFDIFAKVPIKDFSFTDAALIALGEILQLKIISFDMTLIKYAPF